MNNQRFGEKPIEDFIKFLPAGSSASGKTKIWRVVNELRNEHCGIVKWHGPWRKYVYYSDAGWSDADFMLYVGQFLKDVTAEHYAK